jgi:hypothetical protein
LTSVDVKRSVSPCLLSLSLSLSVSVSLCLCLSLSLSLSLSVSLSLSLSLSDLFQVEKGKRFPRKLTGNILFTNYRSKRLLPTKLSLLCSSSDGCESAAVPIAESESEWDGSSSTSLSSSSPQRPPVVPYLIFRSDYLMQTNDNIAGEFLSPILEETHCWVGTQELTSEESRQENNCSYLTCRPLHHVIYPENFTATTLSGLTSEKTKNQKKKKKVTFQLDDPSSGTEGHLSDPQSMETKPRPTELSSFGNYFSLSPVVSLCE